MNTENIARQLVAEGKGIMAADRPSPMFYQMLRDQGIPADAGSYRNWAQLLFTAPGPQGTH